MPGIKLLLSAIGSDLGVLLALNFNGGEVLCAFFQVHNGWRLSAGDVFIGGHKIIWIGPL
jgi:hypothetical protein